MKSKSELRRVYKEIRHFETPTEKSDADLLISNAFFESELYRKAETILTYVSFGTEVDTRGIIKQALADNKTVGVPFCTGERMFFYPIESLGEIIPDKFGIPSVDTAGKIALETTNNSLCIVPGLAFAVNGSRLGYGGGYYDRFLSDNNIVKIGLSYEKCISSSLPEELHDIRVDFILTEYKLRSIH